MRSGLLIWGLVLFAVPCFAQGLPTAPQLTYRGVVVGAQPGTSLSVRVLAWRSETSVQSADALCPQAVAVSRPIDASGRFDVELDSACIEAIRKTGNVWIQLEVNGVGLLPRTQLKAVPFALHAERTIISAGPGGPATTATGLVCGTSAPTNGAFSVSGETGYRAAKLLCEQVSSCGPLAHMCSADEMVRSRQLGLPFTEGWIASGLTLWGTTTIPSSDCGGWRVSANTHIGPSWQLVSGGPYGRFCDDSVPILCCR